jgi:mono/diheme cytochrome c family protein
MRSCFFLALGFAGSIAGLDSATAQETVLSSKLYRIVDGKVDAQTYNGFRRYHAGCNHCHGQDGLGSSFGPSLVDHPRNLDAFRRIVRGGTRKERRS